MSNRSRRASRSPDKSVIKIRTEKNGFGKLKVGAIALLVLLQLCFFYLFIFDFCLDFGRFYADCVYFKRNFLYIFAVI